MAALRDGVLKTRLRYRSCSEIMIPLIRMFEDREAKCEDYISEALLIMVHMVRYTAELDICEARCEPLCLDLEACTADRDSKVARNSPNENICISLSRNRITVFIIVMRASFYPYTSLRTATLSGCRIDLRPPGQLPDLKCWCNVLLDSNLVLHQRQRVRQECSVCPGPECVVAKSRAEFSVGS